MEVDESPVVNVNVNGGKGGGLFGWLMPPLEELPQSVNHNSPSLC